MADAHRLQQLFSNLLENVLRYVNAPGLLKIFPELKAGRLFLTFEDSGPGVPEECLPRLFDRLYRVDMARSRAQGGSGLGIGNLQEYRGVFWRGNCGVPGARRRPEDYPCPSSPFRLKSRPGKERRELGHPG